MVDEVRALLVTALAAPPGDIKEPARALGEAMQAKLTEPDYVGPVAAEIQQQLDLAELDAVKRLLDELGWDLFDSLAPHAASSPEAGKLLSSFASSYYPSPREVHLMAMEALATTGRLTEKAAQVIIATILPKVLLRLPVSKRSSFLRQPFEAALDHAMHQQQQDDTPPPQESSPSSPPQEQKQAEGGEQADDWRGVTAALDFVSALMPPPPQKEGAATDRPTTAMSSEELGYVIGLLLYVLARGLSPRLPPPTSPTTPLHPLVARLLSLLSRALLLPSAINLHTLLSTQPLRGRRLPSISSSRRKRRNGRRGHHEGQDDHHHHADLDDDDEVNGEEEEEEEEEVLPKEELAVYGAGRFQWSASDVSLATYYLVVLGHGPPLPSPLTPHYVASLVAHATARLLKTPVLSSQGLVATHWILARLQPPPPTSSSSGTGMVTTAATTTTMLPPSGIITITTTTSRGTRAKDQQVGGWTRWRHVPGFADLTTDRRLLLLPQDITLHSLPRFGLALLPATRLVAGGEEVVEEEDCWVSMCRSLTGCMVFLSEEESRQAAYKGLQGIFAALTHESRFRLLRCLACGPRPPYSKSIHAILISMAQKATAAVWGGGGHGSTAAAAQDKDSATSPFKSPKVRVFYEGVLWLCCGKEVEGLRAMASSPEKEGDLDCLMAALNLYRFLLLKDQGVGVGLTGVWDATYVQDFLVRLRSLHDKVRKALVLADGSSSSSMFRLHMVEEVVGHAILPMLLRGQAAEDTEPLPPPPAIASVNGHTPPALSSTT